MQRLFLRKQFRSKSFIHAGKHYKTQSLHFNPKRNFAFQQFDAKKNYYKILDVSEKASQGDIKKAFYKLAKQYHPDVNKGNAEKFKEINEAYEVIGDDSKRRSYDDMRKYGSGGSSGSASSSSYSSSKPNSGYNNTSNASRNQGPGGQQHYYYYQDQNGNPYSNNSQYEETLKNYFRQWGQTQAQWKQFEEELKKNQGYYGQQNQRNSKQSYGTYSNINQANQARNAYNQFSQAGRNAEENKYHDYQNAYRKMQEDIYKTYKDEEAKRSEEMERIRRKKEEEFMKNAEKKMQEVLGKVEGAKKFVKNLASKMEDFWKSK